MNEQIYHQRVISNPNYITQKEKEIIQKYFADDLAVNLKEQERYSNKEAYEKYRKDIGKIEWFIVKYLTELWINKEKIHFNAVFFTDNKEFFKDNVVGNTDKYTIKIEYPIGKKDENIFEKVKILNFIWHELYHSTAPTKEIVTKKWENITLKNDRKGLRYAIDKTNYDAKNLEEGAANNMEYKVFQYIINELLPKEEKMIYLRVYDAVINHIKETKKDIEIESLRIESFNWGNVLRWTSYENSCKLYNLLLKSIPNFERLAEHARIDYNWRPLIEAVDGIFGKWMFRKISKTPTNDEEEINKIINELEERLQSKEESKQTN